MVMVMMFVVGNMQRFNPLYAVSRVVHVHRVAVRPELNVRVVRVVVVMIGELRVGVGGRVHRGEQSLLLPDGERRAARGNFLCLNQGVNELLFGERSGVSDLLRCQRSWLSSIRV